jgi:hypothetical protein
LACRCTHRRAGLLQCTCATQFTYTHPPMQTHAALKWRVTFRTTRRGADRRTTARPSTCAGASQRRRRRCPVAQSDSSETWNRALSAIVVVEMYRTILKSALQKQLCAVRALCKPNLHVKRLYSSKCMHICIQEARTSKLIPQEKWPCHFSRQSRDAEQTVSHTMQLPLPPPPPPLPPPIAAI